MEQKPGFGFRPTDEELISYYLKNKIMGNTWLVDDTISEINILNHHPSSFPSLSKIKSNDRVYYFFSRKQYKTGTKRKRSIKSWKWKVGGLVTKIKDESGNKIGKKRGILFDDLDAPKAKGEKSSWVIHEYQITSLPHPNLDSYVLYKIFDNNSKKKAGISNGNSSSDPSQSLVSDMNTIGVTTSIPPEVEQPGHENLYGLSANDLILPMNEQGDPNMSFSEYNNNPNVQLKTPYLSQDDDEFLCGLPPAYRGAAQHLLSDQETQEKYIDPRPKDSVRAINTAPEFEQPGQESVYGLSMNDLSVPINEQVDLLPQDAFDPDTLFSDNNHPNIDDFWSGLADYNGGNFEDVFSDQEFIMQENRNDYRPKKSLSGIIVDYSSDSDRDAESISATSYKGTSSLGDSVGSSNRHFLKTLALRKNIQTSDEPFIRRKTRESQLARCTIPSKQEVTQGMVNTEKKGLLITEEAIERKRENLPYIYLINMIIGFIILLALINNIISVLKSINS